MSDNIQGTRPGFLRANFLIGQDYNELAALPEETRDFISGLLGEAYPLAIENSNTLQETLKQLIQVADQQGNEAALTAFDSSLNDYQTHEQDITNQAKSGNWRDFADTLTSMSEQQTSLMESVMQTIANSKLDISKLPFDLQQIQSSITNQSAQVTNRVDLTRYPALPNENPHTGLPEGTTDFLDLRNPAIGAKLHIRAISRAEDVIQGFDTLEELINNMEAYEQNSSDSDPTLLETAFPEVRALYDATFEQYSALKGLHDGQSITELGPIRDINNQNTVVIQGLQTVLSRLEDIVRAHPHYALMPQFSDIIEGISATAQETLGTIEQDNDLLQRIEAFDHASAEPVTNDPSSPGQVAPVKPV